jgi:hypothetical protein
MEMSNQWEGNGAIGMGIATVNGVGSRTWTATDILMSILTGTMMAKQWQCTNPDEIVSVTK